jgi:hypothetical protein
MPSTEEKLICAQRELAARLRAYPKQVAAGRMTQSRAQHEVACMADIVEDYRARFALEKQKHD